MTTLAPALAKAPASERPKPLDPPVTIATLPDQYDRWALNVTVETDDDASRGSARADIVSGRAIGDVEAAGVMLGRG